MADPRPQRLAALVARLDEAHLDALLVSSLPNIRYLTGFSGTSALLLVSSGAVLFCTDFRYETQAADELGVLAQISIASASLWTALWAQMAQLKRVEIIGFESAHLLHRDFERLFDEGGRWKWRPALQLVESLRESKDAEEVALIRTAGDIALAALDITLGAVRVGMTELEVAGVLEKNLRDRGSESFPFPSIVASGPRSALPHARTSSRAIAPGDLLLLDFGASTGGYCSDVTRTVVVGRASDRQREVHDAVCEANTVARAGVRSGMRGRDADALARDVLARRGLGEAFGHGLGHGIGLEVHEAPRLSRVSDAILPPGAVVTIEPGVYLPGWGGVRIEDDVYLSADGGELLTDYSRELVELS